MNHYRKLKAVMLLLLVCVVAKAELADGKVYNFVNVGKGTSMNTNASGGVNVTATNESSYSQLWYAQSNGEGFTLRNLGNGGYLYSPNATSNGWTVKDEISTSNSVFSATQVSSGYALRVTGNTGSYNYAHADGGGSVVCWESSNQNTQWTINVVSISEADLKANWDRLAEIAAAETSKTVWQGHLNTLFADKACTTLNSTYATMDEATLQTQEAYTALSSTLQNMVLKVHRGDNAWQEDNSDSSKPAWDASYAKKYRVQLYEPYNEPGASASALGINAHTNLNNPTGIFANMQEVLYVMVEGTVEDGATLYLASYVGHSQLNGYNEGVELHEGLNIIPSYQDGNNYCINYVVHTFDTSDGKRGNKAKARKLSDYEDLKIHIEGGHINGYWNKMGDDLYGSGDKSADWDYLEQRATQTDLTVVGQYMVLQFPLLDKDTGGNKGLGSYFNELVNIENVIDEWDNIMLQERFVMGLTDRATLEANDKKSPYSDRPYVFEYTGDDTDGYGSDYSDYYNMHGLAIADNSTYMSGGWKSSNYNCNTMDGVIRDLPTNAGSHWGPAHEIGHQHQGPLNMRGLTEVTNNLFSNISLWYFGETTSRYNGDQGSLENVLKAYNRENSDFFTNNIWAQTHMYYKLFLYYHVLGYNTKFYPRLFEMLRQDPMVIEYNQSGAKSLLHFYKKCCYASGEDLTEFFRAHGFFSVMTDRFVGDYSNAVYNQTQEEIDAAIAEVKAWAEKNNKEQNIAVLFVNDATGGTIKSHKGDNLTVYGETTVCAEMGSYATFKEDVVNASDYECTMSGNSVSMSGTGGVGLAIFNEKGEIIAFGDNTNFTVSAECAAAIAQGEVEVKVLNADNTVAEVEITDEAAVKYSLLGILLDETEEWLALTDETGTKVGYYRAGALTALQEAYNTALEVYENEKADAYSAAYVVLLQALEEVKNNTYDRINIVPGYTYRLENEKYSGQCMYVKDDNSVWCKTLEEADTKQQWVFEATDEEGMYYLKNADTGNYLGELEDGKGISATATKSEAKGYVAISVGSGIWALQCQTGDKKSLNYNDGIGVLGWSHDGDKGSHWFITAVSVDEDTEKLRELQTLIDRAEALIAEVGSIEVSSATAVTLTESSYYCNALYTASNNGDKFTSYSVLCDGTSDTYLHTDYSSNAPAEDHYIRMDVGSGNELQMFNLNYTTRKSGNLCAPTKMVVEASNDDATWVTLREITSGLPTANNTSYTIEGLGHGIDYRYIRMRVYETNTGQRANDHYFFIVSELGLSKVNYAEAPNDAYASIASGKMLDVFNAALTAKGVIATTATGEYESAYNTLKAKYDALLEARKDVDDAVLEAKKAELLTLISSTNSLINSCGTVTSIAGGAFTLSTTVGNDAYYLTGSPSNPSEGSLGNLLDGNVDTYYVSNWNAQTSAPYLQVQLPDGKEMSEFAFTFTSRNSGNAPTPTTIVVSGSNDGSSFTDIHTFTKAANGLPEPANNGSNKAVKWTSPKITATEAYKYLRFTVTESDRSSGGETDGNGFYHFGISEFGLSSVDGYSVTLTDDAGNVTEELLLEAYHETAAAQSVHDMATTENQLQKAIDKLQTLYTALDEAKKSVEYVDYTVAIVGGNAGGGVKYKDADYTQGKTLKAPTTLSAGNLTAIALDGYVAKSITVKDNVITVTYNKVYTVQVVGGQGNGGVTYNGTNYTQGQTFDALQSAFTAESLTAIVPDGYTEKAITVDHETGVVTVAFAAIPLVDTDKYYTFECKAVDTGHLPCRFIRDNGSVIDGRSAEGSLFSFEAADEDNGYYIKSYVSEKYLNHNGTNISASAEKTTVWTIARHATGAMTLTIGSDKYLNNNGKSDCKDGTCTNLQANYHQGGPGNTNYCSLWTLAEGTPLDKSALLTLIQATNTLIEAAANYNNSLNVTEDLVDATRKEVDNAQVKYDSRATTESEYTAALEALQTVHDNLQIAINYATLPVQLTFDANSPIVYKISMKRDGAPLLQYDSSSSMVAVNSDFRKGDKAQGWYFMAAADGQVYIMPYYECNTTLALSSNSFSAGAGKVKAVAIGTEGYTQGWTITANDANSGWYNITTPHNGTTWYFSNHGGTSYKMGFYNDANDAGTLFKFEQISFDKSEAYYVLYNYFTFDVKLTTGSVVGSDAVGYHPVDVADAYNKAYNNATTVLGNENATDTDYTDAYNALKAANEALVMNMPKADKFYRLQNVKRSGEYAYVDPAKNKVYHSASRGVADAATIWTFTETSEGKYTLANLHTGSYMADNGSVVYTELSMYDVPEDAHLVSLTGDGQVGILCGNLMLHADGNGKVVHWDDGAGSGSAWRIVEVEDMSLVNFALTIGKYRHAGLYLNYPVTIPEGVKAYIAHTPNGEEGTIYADELDGTILPARTAVIVKGDAATYNFEYTDKEYDGSEDLTVNKLGGSAYLKYQQVAKEGNRCCVFGQKGGEVGLYKNYVEYTDANGSQTDADKNSVVDTDNGTHFKVSANKIYYEYEPASVSGASAFRFRFNSNSENDGETTAIDNLMLTGDAVIYNLYGQRIAKVAEPGIYIVNGKKIYVSEKMIRDNN